MAAAASDHFADWCVRTDIALAQHCDFSKTTLNEELLWWAWEATYTVSEKTTVRNSAWKRITWSDEEHFATVLGEVRYAHARSELFLETNLASRWEGVRLPRASGKSLDFPGSSPNFPGSFSATSPEVLSLWNLTAIQGSRKFPRLPRKFPGLPRKFPDFPGGQPCLWEA